MRRTADQDRAHRPLTPQDWLPDGPLRRVGRTLRLLDSIPSTNSFLREQAAALGDGAVAAAELQTSGRGRLGRRWESPRGASLMVSCLLAEARGSPLLGLGGLLGAVAACEAIELTTDVAVRVRWPNDLVVNQRKLGGVLAESFPLGGPDKSARSQFALVIGIGINCLQQRGHFQGELASKATSLELESAGPVHRALVAARLLSQIDHWLARVVEPAGGGDLLAAWRTRSNDLGTRVTLRHDGRTHHGTVLDIDAGGDLIVQLDEGGRRCFAAATTTREW